MTQDITADFTCVSKQIPNNKGGINHKIHKITKDTKRYRSSAFFVILCFCGESLLVHLKTALADEHANPRPGNKIMFEPKILITTYIVSTPEKVWNAITDPEITQQYWSGTRIESDWKVGSKVIYRRDGKITDEHVVLNVEPLRLLSHTFHPVFVEEFRNEPPSRVTFEIKAGGQVVRLTVIHDEFEEDSEVYHACSEGWPMLMSSLKTLLETGKPLPEFEFEVESE